MRAIDQGGWPTTGDAGWQTTLRSYILNYKKKHKSAQQPSAAAAQQLASARAFGASCFAGHPELAKQGYALVEPSDKDLPAAMRKALISLHERALRSKRAGAQLHTNKCGRTTQFGRCDESLLLMGGTPGTFHNMRKEDIAAVQAARGAMAALAGPQFAKMGFSAVGEFTALLFEAGMEPQLPHIDGVESFLGCVLNASEYPIDATEFLKHQGANFSAGFGDTSSVCKSNTKKLIKMMEAAAAPGAPYQSAGKIPPFGMLFTNPLHVHRAPAPPAPARVAPGEQQQQRRIFFGAFVKNHSSEAEVIYVKPETGAWWQQEAFLDLIDKARVNRVMKG